MASSERNDTYTEQSELQTAEDEDYENVIIRDDIDDEKYDGLKDEESNSFFSKLIDYASTPLRWVFNSNFSSAASVDNGDNSNQEAKGTLPQQQQELNLTTDEVVEETDDQEEQLQTGEIPRTSSFQLPPQQQQSASANGNSVNNSVNTQLRLQVLGLDPNKQRSNSDIPNIPGLSLRSRNKWLTDDSRSETLQGGFPASLGGKNGFSKSSAIDKTFQRSTVLHPYKSAADASRTLNREFVNQSTDEIERIKEKRRQTTYTLLNQMKKQ